MALALTSPPRTLVLVSLFGATITGCELAPQDEIRIDTTCSGEAAFVMEFAETELLTTCQTEEDPSRDNCVATNSELSIVTGEWKAGDQFDGVVRRYSRGDEEHFVMTNEGNALDTSSCRFLADSTDWQCAAPNGSACMVRATPQ